MSFIAKQDFAFLGTGPVSTEPYHSDAYHELEREKIFKRSWLFFARESELPKAGDFMVKDYDMCGASVLVTRARDGHYRAFHNVCSHRLAKLIWDSEGNASNFICRYHGWGYGLNGNLKNVPDADSFYELDIKRCGLAPIHLQTWKGFIFINFSAEPEQSLAEFMQPVAAKMGEHSLDGFDSHIVLGAEVEVNWKCILDNFQETYHLSFVHNLSVADRSVAEDNPRGHPLSFEFFGPHRLMGVWGNPKHKPAPVEGLAVKFGGVISAGAIQQTEKHKALRHPNWQLDVFGVFPNLLVDIAPTFFFVHEFIPMGAGRTRWFTRIFFPKAKNAGERFSQEYSVAAFRDTVAEDLAVLRTQQKSMLSGAKTEFQFQAHEAMCRHTLVTIDNIIRGETRQAAE